MGARATCLILGWSAWLALLVPVDQASGQVATDGTVGPRVQLDGPDFQIGAELGTRAGGNLFHSFERFSIRTGESATFSGPDDVRNVISRVTGGARSEIDGRLASTIPGADFYFLNPAGVLFGPNASLDVPGSFHVSTADELRFADGAVFSATDPAASSLTIAAPEAFGFLGGPPGAITVTGSVLLVPVGETLSLIGGDLTVDEGGGLAAFHGTVNMTAVGGRSEVTTLTGEISGAAPEDRGNVRLDGSFATSTMVLADGGTDPVVRIRAQSVEILNGGFIRIDNLTNLGSGGEINIEGTSVNLDNGEITANVEGSGRGADIRIVADDIKLGEGAAILAAANAEGSAGMIMLNGGTLAIERGKIDSVSTGEGKAADIVLRFPNGTVRLDWAFVGSNASASGDAGSISIEAAKIALSNGAFLSRTLSSGRAGDIHVEARQLEIDGDFGQINSSTRGAGGAGAITILVGDFQLRDGALISSSTLSAGQGGEISIRGQNMRLERGATISSIAAGTGHGGRILIDTDTLRIFGNLSLISTGTIGGGAPAGDIMIHAAGAVVIGTETIGNVVAGVATQSAPGGGPAGDMHIVAGSAELFGGGTLSAGSQSNSTAGLIRLNATKGQIILRDGAVITTSTDVGTGGRPGRIVVDARDGDLRLTGDSEISTNNRGPLKGGDIEIRARNLWIASRSRISAEALAEGAGGSIELVASEEMKVSDSMISVRSDASGVGGDVKLVADRLIVDGGGAILSFSTGRGDAGTINVRLTDALTMRDGLIFSGAEESGGGEITIKARWIVDLENSKIASTVFGGEDTTAGDITIDPRFIILDSSDILAQAEQGRGGNIRITVDNLIQSPDSVISASAGAAGIDGTVVVSSPEVDLTGGLVVLDVPLLDAAALLRERCAARRDVGASSFTGVGQGGLPPSPDQPLLSEYGSGPAAGASTAPEAADGPETRLGDDPGADPKASVGRLGAVEVGLLGARTDRGALALAPVVLLPPCTGAL